MNGTENRRPLKVRDVNFQKKILTVQADRSKNNRPRDLPLTKAVAKILKHQVKDKNAGEYVFQGLGARNAFYDALYPAFKRYCKKAGIDSQDLNVHSLRRTYCTRLLAKGASPGAVQRLLGHATANLTLEVYTRVRASDLQDAVALLN